MTRTRLGDRRAAEYRRLLIAVQRGRCFYCRCHLLPAGSNHPRAATFEHRVPIALGGEASVENGVASCRKCNQVKADLGEAEFLRAIKDRDEQTEAQAAARSGNCEGAREARKRAERKALGRVA